MKNYITINKSPRLFKEAVVYNEVRSVKTLVFLAVQLIGVL